MKKTLPEKPYTKQEIRNYAATHVFVPGDLIMLRRMLTLNGEIRSDLHYTMEEPPAIAKISYSALLDPKVRPAIREKLLQDINAELEYLDDWAFNKDIDHILAESENKAEFDAYQDKLEAILDNPDTFLDSLIEKHSSKTVASAQGAYKQTITDITNLPPMLQALLIQTEILLHVAPKTRFVKNSEGKLIEVKVEILADLYNIFAPVAEKEFLTELANIEIPGDKFDENGLTVIRGVTPDTPEWAELVSNALKASTERDKIALAKAHNTPFAFQRTQAHDHVMYRSRGLHANGGVMPGVKPTRRRPTNIRIIEGDVAALMHELGHALDYILQQIVGKTGSNTAAFLEDVESDIGLIEAKDKGLTIINGTWSPPRLRQRLANHLDKSEKSIPGFDDKFRSREIAAELTLYYFEGLNEGFLPIQVKAYLENAFPHIWPHFDAVILKGVGEVLANAYENRDKPNALETSLQQIRERAVQEPNFKKFVDGIDNTSTQISP